MAEQAAFADAADGRATHPLAVASQIGPYRILGELGRGGMGVVYRAQHTQLDRPTAIKVLRPELSRSLWMLDRFLTEARAAASVRHPGIVEVYDYGIMPSGRPFIAMELLDGVTLGRRLAVRGRLLPSEAAQLAHQIAGALVAAHARGVVHRDLKPDNVFLVCDPRSGALDRVKLLDFGIARRGPGAQRPDAPAELVLGTPAYMSPEQYRDGDDCDHRTDLYSLGCILFEMLSGWPPYGRGSTAALLARHAEAPIPVLPAGIPRQLADLVIRLLAKHPDDRPRRAQDVIAALDHCLAAGDSDRAARQRSIRTARGRRASPPRERRASSTWSGSIGIALGAASELGAWLAALGLWHRTWRAAPETDAEHDADVPGRDATDVPFAAGTARSLAMNNAPTEPLPPPVEGTVESPKPTDRAQPIRTGPTI